MFITARKRSLRRLCFYTCVLFCPWGEGVCPIACWDTTPPPGTRGRYPLRPEAGTPWRADTPPPGPEAGTPPTTRHPPGPEAGTHPVQCMLGDTGNKRAVLILPECKLVFHVILLTSQKYAKCKKHNCFPGHCVECRNIFFCLASV